MEFKGTKGKFMVAKCKQTGDMTIYPVEGDLAICDMEYNDIEANYNALLISKAPEMLEFINKYKGFLRLEDQIKANTLIQEATELK